MTVPTLANTFKVVMHYTFGLTTFENVFHTTAPSATAEADVAQDFATAWFSGGSFSDIQSAVGVGGVIDVQKYDGSSAPLNVTVSGYTGTSFTGTSDPMPAQCSGIITWRSGLAGRSNRGRTYLGGVSDVYKETDGAQWASGSMSTLQAAADNFLGSLVSGVVVTGLDVYSPLHNTKAPVIAGVYRRYFGSQRRRAEQQM